MGPVAARRIVMTVAALALVWLGTVIGDGGDSAVTDTQPATSVSVSVSVKYVQDPDSDLAGEVARLESELEESELDRQQAEWEREQTERERDQLEYDAQRAKMCERNGGEWTGTICVYS